MTLILPLFITEDTHIVAASQVLPQIQPGRTRHTKVLAVVVVESGNVWKMACWFWLADLGITFSRRSLAAF